MTNGDDAAYPLMGKISASAGLTKREIFAAMAMQGLLAYPNCNQSVGVLAFVAVQAADALIEALDDDKDDSEGGNVASDRGPIQ
jgi:hypothetical protein